jgi:hypothetical protein
VHRYTFLTTMKPIAVNSSTMGIPGLRRFTLLYDPCHRQPIHPLHFVIK